MGALNGGSQGGGTGGSPTEAARQVAILLHDGVCPLEFGAVAELLASPALAARGGYRLVTCSLDGGPVRTLAGMRIDADGGLEVLDAADTVVAPGWRLELGEPPPPLRDRLIQAQARGARLVGLCTGAFLFGWAGLLRGRRVTTHWARAERFRHEFPGAILRPDDLYVDDGEILTSSGSAAGLDLLVHLIARDFGPEMANQVARHHTIGVHRAGNQRQQIARPVPTRRDRSLGPLLEEITERLDETWTVARMARQAHVSPRTLVRRFGAVTGCAPGEWLTLQRLAAARNLLEATAHSLETIAETVGLGSAAALRHHFRRRMGAPPMAFRRRSQGERPQAFAEPRSRLA